MYQNQDTQDKRIVAVQALLVLALGVLLLAIIGIALVRLVGQTGAPTGGGGGPAPVTSAATSTPSSPGATATPPTATPAGPTPTSVPPTAAPSRTFSGTFSGHGNGQTGDFLEYGGRWTIQWSCSSGTRLTVILQQQDQSQIIINSGCPNSRTVALVRQAASYNLVINSDATWTLTIQPS